MPELPEVETVVRNLRKLKLDRQPIVSVDVGWKRTVVDLAPDVFVKRIVGTRIRFVRRRGKYIVLELTSGDTLLVHLRMTGQFLVGRIGDAPDPHVRLVLGFKNGRQLRFRDTRKFGRWLLTARPALVLDALGPEPLSREFGGADFERTLQGRRRQIKPCLLDQRVVAGLGNIYVDETLWQARVHPQRSSNSLTRTEVAELCRAIRDVLSRAIRNRGTSLGVARVNFRSADGRHGTHQLQLNVFRRTGQPCPRCGTAIRRMKVGQRSTHICPACQRQGRGRCVVPGGIPTVSGQARAPLRQRTSR